MQLYCNINEPKLTVPENGKPMPNTTTSKLTEIKEDGSLVELWPGLEVSTTMHPLNS